MHNIIPLAYTTPASRVRSRSPPELRHNNIQAAVAVTRVDSVRECAFEKEFLEENSDIYTNILSVQRTVRVTVDECFFDPRVLIGLFLLFVIAVTLTSVMFF